MSVRKADDFIADVERQFDWYLAKAGWEVADRYLDAAVSLTLGYANGASFSFPGLSTSTFSFTNGPVATSCCAGRCVGSVTCPEDCSKLPRRSKRLSHSRPGSET